MRTCHGDSLDDGSDLSLSRWHTRALVVVVVVVVVNLVMKVAEWFRERDGRLASVRKEGAVGNGGNTAAEVPAVAASSAEVPAAQNSETDATSSATAGTAAEGSENAYEKALETQVSPTNGSAVNAIAEGPETKEMFSGDSVPVPAAGDSGGEGVAMVAGGGAGKEASSGGEEGKEGEAGGEPVSALRLSEDEVAKLKEEQEARCRELAMNVNVFMPYKVRCGGGVGRSPLVSNWGATTCC